LAVAELVSAMPVNGCFYWWTAALAPQSLRRFLSFVAGWTNLLSLATSVASFAFATAATIQQAIIMVAPEWEANNAQLMAIAFGFVFIWMSLAAFRLEDIAWIYIGGGECFSKKKQHYISQAEKLMFWA
jgi:amino acid transporter